MKDTLAENITEAINAMRGAGRSDQEISTLLIGGAVACLVDSIGQTETADFLHLFADRVAASPELDNVLN